MTLPFGDLETRREYSCGCLVYLDELHQEHHEAGLFCFPGNPDHRQRLVRGHEDQINLFTKKETQT